MIKNNNSTIVNLPEEGSIITQNKEQPNKNDFNINNKNIEKLTQIEDKINFQKDIIIVDAKIEDKKEPASNKQKIILNEVIIENSNKNLPLELFTQNSQVDVVSSFLKLAKTDANNQ